MKDDRGYDRYDDDVYLDQMGDFWAEMRAQEEEPELRPETTPEFKKAYYDPFAEQ